jgi:hypothetical protein
LPGGVPPINCVLLPFAPPQDVCRRAAATCEWNGKAEFARVKVEGEHNRQLQNISIDVSRTILRRSSINGNTS